MMQDVLSAFSVRISMQLQNLHMDVLRQTQMQEVSPSSSIVYRHALNDRTIGGPSGGVRPTNIVGKYVSERDRTAER